MNRRELLQGAFATGALSALSLPRARGAEGLNRSEQDEPIVVEGLFAGAIRLSHLRGMQQGGVHCGVAGGPSDMASFAALLRFFDQSSVMSPATTNVSPSFSSTLVETLFLENSTMCAVSTG